jgi:CBS domain-containing protein
LVPFLNVKLFTHFLATTRLSRPMPVKEIMRYGVITISPDESVSRVMHLMTRHRVRHMPVLRDGKLAGIISIGDVVKHRSGV